jgi:hypothetical protein
MRLVHWLALLVLPLLAACEVMTAPPLPAGAARFEAPPAYQLWWAMTQECSARPGSLASIEWYVVPGAHSLDIEGKHVDGYWTSAGNAIVLAEDAMMDASLVRHEMLHALERVTAHPRDYFLGRCGGVVVCISSCLAEAGPPPPGNPAALLVSPSELEIGLAVTPESPSRARYGGYFAVTVTVRNPRNQPVVVSLPASSDGGAPVTFACRVEASSAASAYSDRLADEGVLRFGPGETKHRTYDFYVRDVAGLTARGGLGPGTYRFRTAFGGVWSASAPTITLP